MSWPDYELDDLGPSTPMGKVMYDFARRRPRRASRLLDALDDFTNDSLSNATLVAPRAGNSRGNPQGHHAIEKMSILEIIEDYGGGPQSTADWQRVRAKAVSVVGP
jgi:hypothetical protein